MDIPPEKVCKAVQVLATPNWDAPDAPVAPVGPAGPVGPVAPVAPAVPFVPFVPAGPVGPVNPVSPFGPVGPVGPVGVPVIQLAGILFAGKETEPDTDKPELNIGACENVLIPLIVCTELVSTNAPSIAALGIVPV